MTETVSAVLAFLFSETEGLGAALLPGADGNGHAVRMHAQDGALGRSGHLLHHDRYRSHEREVTYVLAIASHEQAVWQLVRGTSRTEVQLTAGNMYLLVFGASAHAMAMHGVGNLSQEVWPLSERYGSRQRYSLSGSAQYAQGAGPADTCCSGWRARFGSVPCTRLAPVTPATASCLCESSCSGDGARLQLYLLKLPAASGARCAHRR